MTTTWPFRAACAVGGLLCLAGLLPVSPAAAIPDTAPDTIFDATSTVDGLRDLDPGDSTLRGRCENGGRQQLTISQPIHGRTQPIKVTVSNVPDGARWKGSVTAISGDAQRADSAAINEVSDNGRWTFTSTLQRQGPQTFFLVEVRTVRDVTRERACFMVLFAGSRVTGGTVFCRPRLTSSLLSARRPDGDLSVLFLVLPFKTAASQRWSLDFRVNGAGTSQQVTVQERSSKRGVLHTQARLEGFANPRIQVAATDEAARTCAMSLDPANIATEPPPSPARLRQLITELRH